MATAKWEHLKCEFPDKPHNWKRELGQRGRKPRFCPKHRPEPKLSSATTDLYCEIGKHNWIRPPTRGRVPTSCPDHRTQVVITSAPRNENGMVTLHCEVGNHDWERAPQRGKRPTNCPKHSSVSVAPRSVPVNVVQGSETGDPITPKKRGRPRIHETKEEREEAKLAASRERAANLEGRLKENGTHISQQTPYILYKLTETKPGRGNRPPTTTWDKVAEHSPLTMAQYVNAHETDFEKGLYRYEREGKVINPL
jgi:hypothetical protein